MTNLIAKVAELRKLEAKDIPGKYTSDCPEYDYMVGVLNAAPGLLAALGKVHAGDARKLDEIIEMIDFSIPSELMSVEESDEDFDIAPSEYQEMIQMKATLQRYVDLARLMEDTIR